jgi:hypothetical protein
MASAPITGKISSHSEDRHLTAACLRPIKLGAEMNTEIDPCKHDDKKMMVRHQGGGSDTVYALGIIGAWVYYIKRATTNEERLIGFLKGLVWPAFLVYEVFEFLNKE